MMNFCTKLYKSKLIRLSIFIKPLKMPIYLFSAKFVGVNKGKMLDALLL